MNSVRIQLSAATTTIFIRDGWLIVEAADMQTLRGQLNNADGGRLLSVREVSERTGFSCGGVRGWIKRGLLTAAKVGKEYRIKESDLDKVLSVKKEIDAQPWRMGRRRKPVIV